MAYDRKKPDQVILRYGVILVIAVNGRFRIPFKS